MIYKKQSEERDIREKLKQIKFITQEKKIDLRLVNQDS